jgi:hypothetical protein
MRAVNRIGCPTSPRENYYASGHFVVAQPLQGGTKHQPA